MRKIILDIETNIAHDKIWMCVTREIGGDVTVWKEASGLQKYLDSCDLIIMHNGICFDAPVLKRNWNITMKQNQMCDTLVLSRLLSPSLEGGHSLDAWGQRLGFLKMDYKQEWIAKLTFEDNGNPNSFKRYVKYTEGDWFNKPDMPLLETYCIQDTLVTEKVYQHLTAELTRNKFDERSIKLEHNVQAVITKQEENGFKLNERAAVTLLATLQNKLVILETELQNIFPTKTTPRVSDKTGKPLKSKVEVFNPGSRKQIGERLIEKGWKPEQFTENGQPIVDEGTLEGLDFPEAKAIAEFLLLQKRIAQIKSWLKELKPDGRVHGKVITNGAVTGRMTHHSPNMAQVPSCGSPYGEDCRDLWIVEKGYKLVGIDASGLELRMLAHYMKDDAYIYEVTQGDIHTANQKAAGLETRAQAKTFIYAFLYGAGAAKIGKVVGAGAKEGQRLIDSFLENTPKLRTLREDVARICKSSGSLPGLDGRRLHVRSDHAAVNTLLQGAGAIVMKQALVILDERLTKLGVDYKFVANVHDEWQIEVEEAYADMVGKLGVQAIEQAGRVLEMRCPLTGEYRVGNSWKETH
jgi:DNA polymerase I-like protein with 3'-5' exonuclease and polymerase domains